MYVLHTPVCRKCQQIMEFRIRVPSKSGERMVSQYVCTNGVCGHSAYFRYEPIRWKLIILFREGRAYIEQYWHASYVVARWQWWKYHYSPSRFSFFGRGKTVQAIHVFDYSRNALIPISSLMQRSVS